ncbi:MAG TPA: hypothetical protein VKY26_03285 [Actinomycetota bacterium]|nr:hypothetical protein [Actinomycetota bacterium]
MKLILVVVLALVGLFLIVIFSLLLLIGRNLKSMANAIAQVSQLAERVEAEGTPTIAPTPRPKPTMKEIFAVLPSLLKRANTLPDVAPREHPRESTREGE